MMKADTLFYNTLLEHHKQPFDWKTNNCGLFVAKIYSKLLNKDFVSDFDGDYHDKETAFDYIKAKGGWENILCNAGFAKRTGKDIHAGDIVICENAIGVYDGFKGLFAGGAVRKYSRIESAYHYTKE